MTEVAMASGFRSVRRFNEVFQELYDKPPSGLRRAAKTTLTHGGEVAINLPYRPPYDWSAMLFYLKARAIPGVEAVSPGRYARTIALGGERGTILVRQGDGNALQATIRFPKLSLLLFIVERIRRLFDLAADPETIAAHLRSDPALANLVVIRPGLRVPGAWDGFELAIRFWASKSRWPRPPAWREDWSKLSANGLTALRQRMV
jgi:AraC family transcriptional regulator of adaptative response / DNA-3-methyladenine glycosylase II